MVPGNFFGYFLVCYKKVTRKRIDTLCMEFYSGSVWYKLFLSQAMTLCRETYSGFVLQNLLFHGGEDHLRRRSFCAHTPTPWLLPCFGKDSSNGKVLLFERNSIAGFFA